MHKGFETDENKLPLLNRLVKKKEHFNINDGEYFGAGNLRLPLSPVAIQIKRHDPRTHYYLYES
jgi:hypothetical protein